MSYFEKYYHHFTRKSFKLFCIPLLSSNMDAKFLANLFRFLQYFLAIQAKQEIIGMRGIPDGIIQQMKKWCE